MRPIPLSLAALLGLLAVPAGASEPDARFPAAATFGHDAPLGLPATIDATPVAAPLDAQPVPGPFGTALAVDRLDAMRGGDATTTNRADLRGNVGGNTATNVLGAGNRVADGSFANAAGISTVIQNSGSNVLIQNSTIVNVQFVPTP